VSSRSFLVRRLVAGALAALALSLVAIGPALAHPLGNFTINHYAGIRVRADAVLVDVVIDRAEIPAFAEVARLDADGDGRVADAEAAGAAPDGCRALAGSLRLEVGGGTRALEPVAAGLSFPPGTGGLATMRSVCVYVATLPAPFAAGTQVRFVDASFSERIGWREVVVEGDGTTIAGDLPAGGMSDRLTAYPTDLLAQPPDVREVTFSASPGGPVAPPLTLTDAVLLPGAPMVPGLAVGGVPAAAGPVAAVPGGIIPAELSDLLGSSDLSPFAIFVALLVAAALGAGHALTPGHGKTIMAAYLVGSRGTARHAVGLGLSVALSHTIGILVLAGLVVAAGEALPPERFQRIAPIVSAVVVLAIGVWMVVGEVRRRWAHAPALALAGVGGQRLAVARVPGSADHGHAHPHGSEHDHEHTHGDRSHDHGHEHGHGPLRHRHDAPAKSSLSWQGLFTLGLAGGIIPSTSALLILLATVATGQAAYGLLLVVAFGLGMAAVMVAIGLALVLARERVEQAAASADTAGRAPRLLASTMSAAPTVGSIVVLALGVVLTVQAIGGVSAL
jgi:ABC-type nickel/cobalt efflux system permease component RcnA